MVLGVDSLGQHCLFVIVCILYCVSSFMVDLSLILCSGFHNFRKIMYIQFLSILVSKWPLSYFNIGEKCNWCYCVYECTLCFFHTSSHLLPSPPTTTVPDCTIVPIAVPCYWCGALPCHTCVWVQWSSLFTFSCTLVTWNSFIWLLNIQTSLYCQLCIERGC